MVPTSHDVGSLKFANKLYCLSLIAAWLKNINYYMSQRVKQNSGQILLAANPSYGGWEWDGILHEKLI